MGDGYLKADRPVSHSDGFIRFINVVSVLLSIALISLGIWLATRPGDCEKYATVPVFLIGAFFLLVAMLGLFGAWFALVPILYAYLVLTFVVVVGFLILTIFLFATTSKGGGYSVAGQTFKEYRLKDYSGYVQDRGAGGDSARLDERWELFGRGRFSSGGCSDFDCTFIERDDTGMDRRFGCWGQSLSGAASMWMAWSQRAASLREGGRRGSSSKVGRVLGWAAT